MIVLIDPYRCERCGGFLEEPNGPRVCLACREAEKQVKRLIRRTRAEILLDELLPLRRRFRR